MLAAALFDQPAEAVVGEALVFEDAQAVVAHVAASLELRGVDQVTGGVVGVVLRLRLAVARAGGRSAHHGFEPAGGVVVVARLALERVLHSAGRGHNMA